MVFTVAAAASMGTYVSRELPGSEFCDECTLITLDAVGDCRAGTSVGAAWGAKDIGQVR